jgi:hypothetical protein
MIIYQIRNLINDKKYIGQCADTRIRWQRHLARLKIGKHHSLKLQRAYNKYGKDNFNFEVLEENISESQINKIEEGYIFRLDTFKNGYNCTTGGEGIRGHGGEDHWLSKPVFQYNLNGHLIKKWGNLKSLRLTYPNVTPNRRNRIAGLSSGFLWSYENLSFDQICSAFQYDIEGNFIQSFWNVAVAVKILKLPNRSAEGILRAITRNGNSYGFYWTKSFFGLKIGSRKADNINPNARKKLKSVSQLDHRNHFLNIFPSLKAACAFLGIERSSHISDCCKGKRKTAYGFKWRYSG